MRSGSRFASGKCDKKKVSASLLTPTHLKMRESRTLFQFDRVLPHPSHLARQSDQNLISPRLY